MIDWSRIEDLRNDVGADALSEVIELFVEEIDDAVVRLDKDASADKIAADLHFLRGAAANIGLRRFAGLCETGEARAASGQPDMTRDIEAVRAAYASARARLVADLPRWLGAA